MMRVSVPVRVPVIAILQCPLRTCAHSQNSHNTRPAPPTIRAGKQTPICFIFFGFLLLFFIAWYSEEQHRLRALEASKPSHMKGSKAALAAALEGKLGSKLAEAQKLGGVRLWDAADGKGLFPKETSGSKPAVAGGGSGGAGGGGRKAQPKERDHAAKSKRGGGIVTIGDDHEHEARTAGDIVEEPEENAIGPGGSIYDVDSGGEEGGRDDDDGEEKKKDTQLLPGTVRGGWRWTGSLWKVSDRRTAGISEAAATWFERRTVQERLPFDRFIDCFVARNAYTTETARQHGEGGQKFGGPIVRLEGINVKPLDDNLDDVIVHRGNRAPLGHGAEASRQERIANAMRLPVSGAGFLRERRWGSCALVGSSGSLRSGPRRGAAIDSHDVVVRLNQAPTWGYTPWVGSKTTHRVLNRLWARAYRTSWGVTRGMALPLERDVSLLITRATGQEYELLRDFVLDAWGRRDVQVLYMSSRAPSAAGALLREYRARSCAAGAGPYVGLNVPSSGLVAVVLLTHLCSRVDVYGLGGGVADSGWKEREGGEDVNNNNNNTGGAAAAGAAGAETVDPYHYYRGEQTRERSLSLSNEMIFLFKTLFFSLHFYPLNDR